MASNIKTVLYIEDDDANRTLVRKLLRAEGYEVLLAEDGVSGIDLAKETEPALILMDMNMPGLDGYEASTRIKSIESLHDVPIIALTANVLSGDRERSLIAGCDGYITKPIDPDTFADEIQVYLNGQREKVSATDEMPLLREYRDKLVLRLEKKVRDLTEALQQVEQANRTKSDFLAMMSHELRTPLNSIINYPELLLQECHEKLNDDHKQWLQTIRENGNTLLGLVVDMLEFVSMDGEPNQTTITPIAFQEVLQSSLRPHKQLIDKKGLSVNIQVEADLPTIYSDSQHMLKAIDCLISNAAKFTEKGNITITCEQVNVNNQLLPDTIRAVMQAGQVHILTSVCDTGIGIAEHELQSIFDDFTQVDNIYTRRQGGIGIGLAISRKLVSYHGGQIWADSKPGVGSCFYILLPQNSPHGQGN